MKWVLVFAVCVTSVSCSSAQKQAMERLERSRAAEREHIRAVEERRLAEERSEQPERNARARSIAAQYLGVAVEDVVLLGNAVRGGRFGIVMNWHAALGGRRFFFRQWTTGEVSCGEVFDGR